MLETPIPEASLTTPKMDIAFGSMQGLKSKWFTGSIFLMSENETLERALIGSQKAVHNIPTAWSKDGRALGFGIYLPANENKCPIGTALMYDDGNTKVIPCSSNGSWSPDNQKVVLYAYAPAPTFQILDLRTNQINQILKLPLEDSEDSLQIVWSPHGGEIAYEMKELNVWSVWIMREDGTGSRTLTPGRHPDWSSARAEIAYDYAGAIWIYDLNTLQTYPITEQGGTDQSPSWSPDGNEIVFQSSRDGNAEIYRIRRDGTNLQRLTRNLVFDGLPAWRPNTK